MLKKQEMDSKSLKICFRPDCSSERIFVSPDSHEDCFQCTNWIISLRKLKNLRKNEEIEQIKLGFGNSSFIENINSLIIMTRQQTIKKYLDLIRNELIKCAENSIQMFINKVQQKYFSIRATQIINHLYYLRQKIQIQDQIDSTIKQITAFSKSYLQPLSGKAISIKFPFKKLNFNFMKEIKEVPLSSFYDEWEAVLGDQLLSASQMKKLKEFILQDPSPYNKLQVIGSYCNKKIGNHHVSVGEKRITLQCPFCPEVIQDCILYSHAGAIKDMKKKVAQKTLTHCYQVHNKQLIKGVIPKLFPKNTMKEIYQKEVMYQQAKSQIIQWGKLHIIDRQSGIPYKQAPENTYCLQILSQNNRQMAKGKHIVTTDRKATEILIYWLMLDICSDQSIGFNNISIESNSCSKEKAEQIYALLNKQTRITPPSNVKIEQNLYEQSKKAQKSQLTIPSNSIVKIKKEDDRPH